MDKANILKQIKDLIKFSAEVVENKFLDAKLVDGETIVRVEADELAVGLPLLVITEDGLIPAPTGEHTLEDGTVVVVDEAGIITAITPREEEVEAPEVVEEALEEVVEEEEKEEVLEEEVKDEIIEEMKKKLLSMEERVAEVEKMMSEMLPVMKESAQFSSTVLDKLDNFVKDTPAQLEFQSIKSEYKNAVEKNKESKVSGLEGIKNMRKK
jgi:hypothetical protein